MKSFPKILYIIIIILISSCYSTGITITENSFDKDMEKEWISYIASVDQIVEKTNKNEILLKLKNNTTKMYMKGKDDYDNFPYSLTLEISRIITKIDTKLAPKVKKLDRYKIVTINPSKEITLDLENDNFKDDTLSFIGELDDGKSISFTQKDLKSKFIWPLKMINITSPYGFRNDPFLNNKVKFHHGLDLAANFADPVRASNNGKVIFASKNGGYGLTVMLLHHSNILTLYAHLSKILVKNGEFINKGTIIGEIGSTGRSTGPHLHFEIRKNKKSINPLFFINKK